MSTGRTLHITGVRVPAANRQFKDSVFRDLFGSEENRAYALSLYNALAGTSYDDPGALELNTVDNVMFMGMRNDVSFLVGDEMVLFEHQSTPNKNMPLRGLLYLARLYEAHLAALGRSVYTGARVMLPTPRFVVFYNGALERPEREVMRLSDSFSGEDPAVEVTAVVLNVNEGRNAGLAAACEALRGYAFLVSRTRGLCGTMGLAAALEAAIDECIARGDLVDYLARKRTEVVSMFLTEWDEEAYRENLRNESFEQGLEQGLERGYLGAARGYVEATGAAPGEAMEALKVPEGMRPRIIELLSEHRD